MTRTKGIEMRIGMEASVAAKGPKVNLLISRLMVLLWLSAGVVPLTAQSQDARPVTLPGHVIRTLAEANRLPRTQQVAQDPLSVTVVLNLSDEAGRDALAKDLNDPDSPYYNTTIGLNEFTARFGPTQQAYDSVLAYLRQNGFTLTSGSVNRRTLTVSGTRAQAERAFNVNIDDYQLGDRTFHAISSEPSVPAALAPLIASVLGLSNKAQWTPAVDPSPAKPASTATAYNGGLPPGIDGSGQWIGLIEFANFYLSDVKNWLKWAEQPSSQINQLYTSVINAESQCTPSSGNPCTGSLEVLLDIEAVMGMAPGANVIVYLASFGSSPDANLANAINGAATDLIANHRGRGTLSLSWTECEGDVSSSEATSLDNMLADYAAMGLTLFAGSGDHGLACHGKGNGLTPNAVSFPSDAAHTVSVGGTILNVYPDNSYQSESWWGAGAPAGSSGGGFGGGFGVSQYIPQPGYQSSLYQGEKFRSVPDVSAEAKPGIIVCQASTTESPNCTNLTWGTSLAAPLWAGIWALNGQVSVHAGGNTKTASNGFLYKFPDAFHTPASMNGPDNDFQHLGLGSPNIDKLIAMMNPPRADSYNPTRGPASGGTTVTITGVSFIGVKGVNFGGVAATNVTVLSDTQLTAVTPVALDTLAIVELVTPGGTAVAPGVFAYLPSITAVNPSSGPLQGGTEVTVTGALAKGYTFTFGGSAATGVSCSSTKCTMVSPAHVPGLVDVVVQTPSGIGNSTLKNGFTYQGLSILRFSPTMGPTTGGSTVEIFGTSLINSMTVSFGGPNGNGIDCSSDGTGCFLFTPAHAAGAVTLTVTANGYVATSGSDQFQFKTAPTITSVSPASGTPYTVIAGLPPLLATVVKLTGTGFSTKHTAAFFGGVGTPVTCSSTTTCTTSVPTIPGVTQGNVGVSVVVNGIASNTAPFDYFAKIVLCKGGSTCQ